MKGQPPAYQLHIFTLRLWQEPLDHQVFEWRGEVKNTSTGEVRYFRSADALYNALHVMLAAPSAASHNHGDPIDTEATDLGPTE